MCLSFFYLILAQTVVFPFWIDGSSVCVWETREPQCLKTPRLTITQDQKSTFTTLDWLTAYTSFLNETHSPGKCPRHLTDSLLLLLFSICVALLDLLACLERGVGFQRYAIRLLAGASTASVIMSGEARLGFYAWTMDLEWAQSMTALCESFPVATKVSDEL